MSADDVNIRESKLWAPVQGHRAGERQYLAWLIARIEELEARLAEICPNWRCDCIASGDHEVTP